MSCPAIVNTSDDVLLADQRVVNSIMKVQRFVHKVFLILSFYFTKYASLLLHVDLCILHKLTLCLWNCLLCLKINPLPLEHAVVAVL